MEKINLSENMEKINLSENIVVYKYKLDYDKNSVIDELYSNIDISKTTLIDSPDYPGIQSDFIIRNGEWESIYNKISKIILNDFYKNEKTIYTSIDWVFISNVKNNKSGFHHHLNMKDRKSVGQWNYTFYVQMPDKLKNDDGELQFKDDKQNVFSILPKEGELYIFNARYLHQPKTNTSSTKDRIVIAGTFSEVKLELSRRKNNISLF
jgi:hypothetical protein